MRSLSLADFLKFLQRRQAVEAIIPTKPKSQTHSLNFQCTAFIFLC